MILALFTKGKKTVACIMLALIYFETIVPSYAIAAAGVISHKRRMPEANLRSTKNKPRPAITPAIVPAATPVSPAHASLTTSARKAADMGGPTQPEMQAFHSVGGDNIVDLFTGDFSYSIPLIDVGGYPLAIGYNSGISMDQEASWVGLGWNINPGTITRNMRGVPDDFNGNDTITKAARIRENKTTGVTTGFDLELAGWPLEKVNDKEISDSTFKLGAGASLGIFKNTYRGWGMEVGLNASISVGKSGMGSFTGGLSATNSSQEGFSISPSFSVSSNVKASEENMGLNGTLSISSTYNSRAGIKGLQISGNIRQTDVAKNNSKQSWRPNTIGLPFDSYFSFAYPSYTPTITLPYSSTNVTVTLKAGFETKVVHPNFFISGYVSKQKIEKADQRRSMKPYGYLNYQDAAGNASALLDFNREKDIPYREKPEETHIAIPSYTYDLFSMSGEGTGGMFRAYRGDIGYVHDHAMRTKDKSDRYSADIGFGDLVHAGVDLNFTRAFTQTGPWLESNPLAAVIDFKKSEAAFEAAYFRNPGEKTVNSDEFYDAIGGDDLVSADIYQAGISSALTNSTRRLNRYKNGRLDSKIALSSSATYKKERDKRTQVISYLTAKEASEVGLSKYIENYAVNKYTVRNCVNAMPETELDQPGGGLRGHYYWSKYWDSQELFDKTDSKLRFNGWRDFNAGKPDWFKADIKEGFSVRWEGRIKAPVSGAYTFATESDDGSLFRMKGLTLMDYMGEHTRDPRYPFIGDPVNLVGGQVYQVQVGYNNYAGSAEMYLNWTYPGEPRWQNVPTEFLYLNPVADTFVAVADTLYKEQRINSFRKENHISEIDVLNADGKRYVYGIPVYNLKQKEATFSVNAGDGDIKEGLVKYTPGEDDNENGNSTKGIDNYFSGEEVSAYAHSFLLTGILSADYTDLTGDGISPDDPGDAIKFNYSKVAGIMNPYKWRAPYTDSATYNEGLKTDTRDDRGSYVYGEKELWYLNSIESKNIIATFKLGDRKDLLPIDDKGLKQGGVAKKLEEINLYTKADFMKHGVKAVPIKTVHFEYSYELCRPVKKVGSQVVADTGKLTLKKIWFSYNGNDKGQKNPYVFRYNKKNPLYNTKSYDRWGNYKDPLQNPGSTANNIVSNADYPYALQDSTLAAENAAAWTLDSITLPSGGRMKIEYESDDYAYVQNKRAVQYFQVAGFSAAAPASLSDLSNKMYGSDDYMYVAINVPEKVNSLKELMYKYLDGLEKVHFRLYVKMPSDNFGSGSEYVPAYARIDRSEAGFINDGKTIWVKMKGINAAGEDGSYSPLAQSAIQFLKLNLPSKAMPGSDVGDDLDLATAVKVLFSQADNIRNMVQGFNDAARSKGWAKEVDLSRTLARLTSPKLKKLGGGLRVKRMLIYDHWNAMTKQKESVYGQEYKYTTVQEIGGVNREISSGVASYEPMLGGEENAWHLPVEYKVQVGPLAPATMGYTEEPLGESFFPAASVGYSKVRVRSVHAKNTRSANGFQETRFYTTYDFPVITEKTAFDDNTKKRYRPALANFLKINAKHYLTITQGFKVELNDMNGKVRSQASYAETNDKVPFSFVENYYRIGNQNLGGKLLDNTVMVINPQGVIDPSASIGKDIELMMDMREQRSVTNGNNFNVNGDFFSFSFPPVFLVPSFLSLFQREENLFRSAGATKVISRHGILDSVVVSEKGSKVTTHNLLYDSETGEPVLTSTINEFNDTIFHFTYPSGWAYDGMSGAYKNIGISFDHIQMRDGKIISGLSAADVTKYFTGGDELLIWSRQKTGGMDNCNPEIATWPNSGKLWVVDANAMINGSPELYFMDREGVPFTGNDMTIKVIRSGRKNINATVGAVNMLKNPLVRSIVNGQESWSLVINDASNVIDASATEFQQFWKVADKKKRAYLTNCAATSYEAYIGDQECLPVPFVNQEISKVFTKNDCDSLGIPSTYEYTVPQGYYRSFVSQADADSMARADLDSNGQQYANEYGHCTFYNAAVQKSFKKNNCPGDTLNDDCGTVGVVSSVIYTVPAHKYSSYNSQAEADSLALAELNAKGQAYANSVGFCTFRSHEQAWAFTRNNCGGGTTVIYTVPEGTYSSTVSQEHADSLALADIQQNGQNYANRYGGCGEYTYVKLSMINRQNSGDLVYETMYFQFFADQECTIPKTVTNLRVNWIEHRINCNGAVPVQTSSYTDCSGSSFTGLRQLVNQDDGKHCWIWDYELAVGDGYVPR